MKFLVPRSVLLGALAVAASALPVQRSQAGMLALYDFTSYTTSSATGAAATSSDPNVTASNYAPNGPAFVTVGGGTPSNYFFTGSGNPTPGVGTQSGNVPATEAASVTAGTYFSLTLTPAAGGALSFNAAGGGNTLTFDLRVRNTTAGSTVVPFTESLAVRSSVDNFVADLGTATGTVSTANTNTGFINQSFSLTSLGTLATGTAITFRIYPFDTQNSSQDDFTVDNLVVNGTVPEPSSVAALLSGAVILVLAWRRGLLSATAEGEPPRVRFRTGFIRRCDDAPLR